MEIEKFARPTILYLKVHTNPGFQRLRTENFDVNDKPRRPKEKDEDLEALFVEDAAQSSVELAKQLGVNHTTVLRRLHREKSTRKGSDLTSTIQMS